MTCELTGPFMHQRRQMRDIFDVVCNRVVALVKDQVQRVESMPLKEIPGNNTPELEEPGQERPRTCRVKVRLPVIRALGT